MLMFFLLQELMNEQSMDQQLLMNQQHSLGETDDTTIKPQVNLQKRKFLLQVLLANILQLIYICMPLR